MVYDDLSWWNNYINVIYGYSVASYNSNFDKLFSLEN